MSIGSQPGQEADRGQKRPVSGGQRFCASRSGFTLLEMTCVLAVVALLAALVLPRVAPGTSQPRLQAYAMQVAIILRADRTEAMRSGRSVATAIDAVSRSVRSGTTGETLTIADDVAVSALLPARCGDRPALSTISFFPNGMSCGGSVELLRGERGFEVRTNWFTGGVEIVPRGAS
jgi:general secretion pathway protein H